MIRNVINQLKHKRNQLTNLSSFEQPIIAPVEITISEETDCYVMYISNYVDALEYSKKKDEIDKMGISNRISMSLLWNSCRQKINKGIYYIFLKDDDLYNIWINGKEIKIDERLKVGEETYEKIISFKLDSNDYSFTSFKHDKIGSTFYTKYYGTQKMDMGKLSLNKEEAYEEIMMFLNNVLEIENILDIVDINLLMDRVYQDLLPHVVMKEYTYDEGVEA